MRKGNPKNIKDWKDLVRPYVEVIVATPKTSGGGRWAFLARGGAIARAKTDDPSTLAGLRESQAAARAARDFRVYETRAIFPASARAMYLRSIRRNARKPPRRAGH